MRLLVAVFALLVFASPAHASWQENRALLISKIVWHHPCVDRSTFSEVPQAEIDKGSSRQVEARAFVDDCRIEYGSGYAPHETDWETFCSMILHEEGHLAGYRDWRNTADPLHSLDKKSVMYAQDVGPDHRCRERGRPWLEYKGYLLPTFQRKVLPAP